MYAWNVTHIKFVYHVAHPKTERGCLQGGVTENGRTRNPLTLWTVPVLVNVRVWFWVTLRVFSRGTLQQQQQQQQQQDNNNNNNDNNNNMPRG